MNRLLTAGMALVALAPAAVLAKPAERCVTTLEARPIQQNGATAQTARRPHCPLAISWTQPAPSPVTSHAIPQHADARAPDARADDRSSPWPEAGSLDASVLHV